jgi:hypothetical protein
MLKTVYILVALTFCKVTAGQDINLIIQVNEKLQQGSFTNMYVTIDRTKGAAKYYVDYVPGNLKLPSVVNDSLKADSSKSICLHLTYNTFNKENHQTAHFFTKLTQRQFQQPYLIWNIYDFRNSQYRRWYQTDKKQAFASEIVFPNSGILIRKG